MALKIENRVGIAAPAEVIWEILADIPGWEAWNPLYPKASGVIRIGETLTLTLTLPGQKPEVIQPRVMDWVPLEQLLWSNSLGGGMVKTVRYIEIENLSAESCIFSNGEVYTGLLSPWVVKMLRPSIKAGFAAFSEAMKTQAEAAYAKVPEAVKAKARAKASAKLAEARLEDLKPAAFPAAAPLGFGKSVGRLKKS